MYYFFCHHHGINDMYLLLQVVKERWGSLGKLGVSVTSNSAAPSHAHLHANKNRIRQQNILE
jgi:hypothetical protein